MSLWPTSSYCLTSDPDPADSAFQSLASEIYRLVCRTEFSAPGFCQIDPGDQATSQSTRRMMVRLKRALQDLHRARTQRELQYITADRFDQQNTTKFHIDSGPPENLLMLGYEPSEIVSEVALADYSRCARELSLTPDEFLTQHNPMFAPGAKLLEPFVTRLESFSNHRFQIVLINNSLANFGAGWQGVMHTAAIRNADESKRRVINSTLLGVFPPGTPEAVSERDQEEFQTTTRVRRRGHDKPDLADDEWLRPQPAFPFLL